MLDWLGESLHRGNDLSLFDLTLRLGTSFLLGCVVAGVYILTQRKERTEVLSLATTLVLLTILITMVTLVIGNSVARAFSLVGALAIVRFRTVVEDTRDTAFVIFAVVVGMGVGAEAVQVSLVGIPIVAAAAILAGLGTRASGPAGDYTLIIRLGLGRDPGGPVRAVLDKHLADLRLRSTITGRQGAALDLTYLVRFRAGSDEVALVTELNRVEGVQSVELRRE